LAIGTEGEREGISKTPGEHLQIGAVGTDAVDGAVGFELAFDFGEIGRTFAEGSEGPREGFAFVAVGREVVLGGIGFADEGDVARGNVVEAGIAFEPAECGAVFADNAGVAGGALAKINPAVVCGRGVGVMIAEAGHAFDDGADLAGFGDAEDFSAFHDAAFGDVEIAVEEGDAGPGAVGGASDDFGRFAVFVDTKEARRGENFAVAVAGFDNVEGAGIVEGDAGGEGQIGGDDFDFVAGGKSDVGGIGMAGWSEFGFAAAGGGAHDIAAA
jgi:hypothetical protein